MRYFLLIVVGLIFCHNIIAQPEKWGYWTKWGDQGNGTYLNPIIPSDYSDIDCIRVGDDYYAISSTMQFSPGMTILHSKDLVNWRICGNIIADLTEISPALNWDRMNRYGRGVWAGTLRYHNHRFYLYFGTPDEGYFMTSASQPEGPWEPLTPLLSEAGWDDCTVMYSLTDRPGWMRLKAFLTLKPNQLLKAGNTLTQRCFRKEKNEVVVKIDISKMASGQRSGLCHFSSQHGAIGVFKEGDIYFLEFRENDKVKRIRKIRTQYIWFKSNWGLDGVSYFSYSLDGKSFSTLDASYQMVCGFYRGDRVGIYCFNDEREEGFVDIDYFMYE